MCLLDYFTVSLHNAHGGSLPLRDCRLAVETMGIPFGHMVYLCIPAYPEYTVYADISWCAFRLTIHTHEPFESHIL